MNKKNILVAAALAVGLIAVAPAAHATECVPSEAYTIEHEAVYETVVDVPEHTIEHAAVTEQRLVTEEQVIEHPAVYETVLVSEEVPYQAAVYETEYEFVHKFDFFHLNPKWKTDPNWNAQSNPHSIGWIATGNTRQGSLISAEVPFQPAVYEDVLVTEAWTETIPAVYETVVITPAFIETVPATYKDVLVTEAWTEEVPAVVCPVEEEPVTEEPVDEEPVVTPAPVEAPVQLVAASSTDNKDTLAETGGDDVNLLLLAGIGIAGVGVTLLALRRRAAARR